MTTLTTENPPLFEIRVFDNSTQTGELCVVSSEKIQSCLIKVDILNCRSIALYNFNKKRCVADNSELFAIVMGRILEISTKCSGFRFQYL